MPTIHPTHQCFDDALEYLNALAVIADVDALLEHVLVHAVCCGDDSERPFVHAWVERGADTVIDAGLMDGERVYYDVDRREYYAAMLVQRYTVYSPLEASRENFRTGVTGPWAAEYIALTRDGRARRAIVRKIDVRVRALSRVAR